MKKIVDAMNVIYNKKIAEKKAQQKGGNKKPAKATNKAMGYKGAESRQMGVNDLVGSDEDYGSDYGQETNPNAQRIKDDVEDDFM